MSTILLMKATVDMSMPRPWNRASSQDEAMEMLVNFARERGAASPLAYFDHTDTEKPVCLIDGYRFYAFVEHY